MNQIICIALILGLATSWRIIDIINEKHIEKVRQMNREKMIEFLHKDEGKIG